MNEVRQAPVLSNRMLPRACAKWRWRCVSIISPSPVPMHRRVTHLGTSLGKRLCATEALVYPPRRTFSTTRPHHATHYETLFIPRHASKSQIKVSTLTNSVELFFVFVPHASP